jgi:hypothetical protein
MRDFIFTLHKRNALVFWTGMIALVSAFASLGLMTFDRSATSDHSGGWSEVFFYSLYTCIITASLGWLLPMLNVKKQRFYYSLIIAAIVLFAIVLQWIIGLDSGIGINNSSLTPRNALLILGLRWAFICFFLLMVILSTHFFVQRKVPYSQHYSWGIRMGTSIFTYSLILLGAIIWLMKNSRLTAFGYGSATNSVLNIDGINFAIPFYIGVHALQIIPLVSYYLFEKKRQASLFSITYVIVFLVFLIVSMLK